MESKCYQQPTPGLSLSLPSPSSSFPAIALVSLGVRAILAESVVVFILIKFVGAAYLMYLGVQAIRHRYDHTDAATSLRARPTSFRLVREGFFVGIGLASDSLWALTAGTARAWFARNPKRPSHMGAGGGVVMIGLGGALAITGNKS